MISMNVMKIPTSVFLDPAPIPPVASSASVPLVSCCLITDEGALILARASASRISKMESVQCPKLSTPRKQNAAAVRCQEKAGVTPVSCAPKTTKLHSRICVHMAMELSLVFMTHVKMSTSVLRAQASVPMVSVSTPTGLFAVNVRWATTWITLECAVWILTSVPSAIHVEMGHAPMRLGVLNAIATKALSQDP